MVLSSFPIYLPHHFEVCTWNNTLFKLKGSEFKKEAPHIHICCQLSYDSVSFNSFHFFFSISQMKELLSQFILVS